MDNDNQGFDVKDLLWKSSRKFCRKLKHVWIDSDSFADGEIESNTLLGYQL